MPAKNTQNSNATKKNTQDPKTSKTEAKDPVQEVKKKTTPKKDEPKKAEPKKNTKQTMPEDKEKKSRYFKCIYNGKTSGRYSGLKPKQAANKALTSIIKENGGNNECIGKKFKFEMIECTRGGRRKISLYEGRREKLEKPLEVTIKGVDGEKKIVYNFSNKLHKVKEEKQTGGSKSEKPEKKVTAKKAPKPTKATTTAKPKKAVKPTTASKKKVESKKD